MNERQFEAFLRTANGELREKQRRLGRDFGIGTYPRWWFEQRSGKLQFLDEAGRVRVEAEVVDIGSYAPKANTWKWAWANESVVPALRKKAEPLKELATITGMDVFCDESAFSVDDESMAWELTAMAVKHLDALGCYRAPAADGDVYMFLGLTAIARVALK